MFRLLTILDEGVRGKTDPAQSDTSHWHIFTTSEINKGFACKTLAEPMSDKIVRNGSVVRHHTSACLTPCCTLRIMIFM